MFWKTEDRAIDKLLGAPGAPRSAPPRLCREFDPDLASAYIEHGLTAAETARYESHLSECASCRKCMVSLARMVEADGTISHSTVKSLTLAAEGQSGLRRLLGALAAPQWAMAAAAVLVMAISIPVLLSSRKQTATEPSANTVADNQRAAATVPAQSAAAQEQQIAKAEAPGEAGAAAQPAPLADNRTAEKEGKDREQAPPNKDMLATAKRPAAEAEATGASPPASPVAEPKIAQAKTESSSSDQPPANTAEQAKPASTPAEPELPKIDPDKVRSLPEDKNPPQVTTITAGRVDGDDSRKQSDVVRDSDNTPPAPPPNRQAPEPNRRTDRGMTAGAGSSAFRERRSEPPRGAAEKKVGGRKFWLRDDVWTDREYNPDKEMPVVTVIRDSDVYRELIAKHAGMKPFLVGFASNERVIFVYKGTIYKLIPQDGGR